MPYKRSKRGKGTSLSKSQKNAMKKIAEQVFDQESEDKSFVYTHENLQLNHNIPDYVYKFLGDIQQGVSDGNTGAAGQGSQTIRIGDEIELKNINIRVYLANKLDRPNVIYKGCLFWYPVGVAPTNAMVWCTQSNKLLDRYNRDNIKVIDQFIVKSTNNYAQPTYAAIESAVAVLGKEHTYLATLNKSYKNKKIKYDNNGIVPKGWNIGMSIVCYDSYGTLQTDNIASYAYQSLITFQDA